MKPFNDIYDNNAANIPENGLCPVFFLEKDIAAIITITEDGDFVTAITAPLNENKKSCKTIVPVTEESASRTGGCCPHAIFDNLQYCAGDYHNYYIENDSHYKGYLNNLLKITESDNCPLYIKSIYKYVSKGTMIADLISIDSDDIIDKATGEIKLDEKHKPKILTNSKVVVFKVQLTDDSNPEVWTRKDLIDFYQDYYRKEIDKKEKNFDVITGENVYCSNKMPTNVRFSGDKTKLISNDCPVTLGYESTMKAFNTLRWGFKLQKNAGIGSYRCALFDTATNNSVDIFDLFSDVPNESTTEDLKNVISDSVLRGESLDDIAKNEKVYFIAVDSDSNGRASLCSFEQLSHSTFFNNIKYWQNTMYMTKRNGEHYTPNVFSLIKYTFGRIKKKDEKYPAAPSDAVMKKYFKQLIDSIVFGKPISKDFVVAITNKVSKPQSFEDKDVFIQYLYYAEAIIRKFYIDYNKGDVSLTLNPDNMERDYLFGRLLAAAEYAEYSAVRNPKHVPASIKLWTRFGQEPAKTWKQIKDKINPYMSRMRTQEYGRYVYCERIISEIEGNFSIDDFKSNKPLSPIYILGYNHQKTYLFTKNNETAETEKTETADEN